MYLGSDNLNLIQKIYRCEKIYRRFNLRPIFRLTDTSQLEILDRTLEQLGYSKQDSVSVQVRSIVDSDILTSKSDLDLTIETELSQEWLDHFVHAANLPTWHWSTMSAILEMIPNPTCFAWLKNRQRFCSCGLRVLENDYLGLFFLVTAKKQRRQGYASQLILAMLNWGKANGATKAYLQVETENQEGINLYNKLAMRLAE